MYSYIIATYLLNAPIKYVYFSYQHSLCKFYTFDDTHHWPLALFVLTVCYGKTVPDTDNSSNYTVEKNTFHLINKL